MSMKALSRQAARLSDKLQPRPRIINVSGAKEELLARLEYQIAQEQGENQTDQDQPDNWSEQDQRDFTEMLEQS